MTQVPNLTLNNGNPIPQLGLGVYQIPNGQVEESIAVALANGYRHIDTAAVYNNEEGVGRAIAASDLAREELFITTKLWLNQLSGPGARIGLAESLEKLKLSYVDLYLLHWPGTKRENYVAAWQTLQELQSEGLIKNIGVSNFLPAQIEDLVSLGGAVPVVNQIELHPYFQNSLSEAKNTEHQILTEAWSPLARAKSLLDDATLVSLAQKYEVSVVQLVLRWHLQKGRIVIPKSATPERIKENIDIFGFVLQDADVAMIDSLNLDQRTGPDPTDFEGK